MAQGAELIGFNCVFPTDATVDRLNALGQDHYTLIVPEYPSLTDAQRLSRIQAHVNLNVARGLYPKPGERDALAALPAHFTLEFSTDYWPQQPQMDLFNTLPQAIRLRVTGLFPTAGGASLIRGIRGLQSIQVSTNFDPADPAIWSELGEHAMIWNLADHIPSASALAAFARGSTALRPRRLVIDQDFPLLDDELARLRALPIDVEWVRSL